MRLRTKLSNLANHNTSSWEFRTQHGKLFVQNNKNKSAAYEKKVLQTVWSQGPPGFSSVSSWPWISKSSQVSSQKRQICGWYAHLHLVTTSTNTRKPCSHWGLQSCCRNCWGPWLNWKLLDFTKCRKICALTNRINKSSTWTFIGFSVSTSSRCQILGSNHFDSCKILSTTWNFQQFMKRRSCQATFSCHFFVFQFDLLAKSETENSSRAKMHEPTPGVSWKQHKYSQSSGRSDDQIFSKNTQKKVHAKSHRILQMSPGLGLADSAGRRGQGTTSVSALRQIFVIQQHQQHQISMISIKHWVGSLCGHSVAMAAVWTWENHGMNTHRRDAKWASFFFLTLY